MKKYVKPLIHSEEFAANQFVAGCEQSIVSGADAVKVYCVKTSYTTIFTNSNSACHYKHDAFTSTSAATSFFGSLFQWGNDVAEAQNGGSNNAIYNSSNVAQNLRRMAEAEIDNGFAKKYTDTILIGANNSGVTHAGYALDYKLGNEGKFLS